MGSATCIVTTKTLEGPSTAGSHGRLHRPDLKLQLVDAAARQVGFGAPQRVARHARYLGRHVGALHTLLRLRAPPRPAVLVSRVRAAGRLTIYAGRVVVCCHLASVGAAQTRENTWGEEALRGEAGRAPPYCSPGCRRPRRSGCTRASVPLPPAHSCTMHEGLLPWL